jgi:Phosphotransferase enzyme family
MQNFEEAAKDTWRILLFANNGSELLLLKRPSGLCLPELRIPCGQRLAPNLNAEAKRVWRLDTVCLSPLELPHPDHERDDPRYHVMELREPDELARFAPNFVEMSAVKQNSFALPRDYLAVQQAMGVGEDVSLKKHPGPFSEFGAFEQISAWVAEQLRPIGRLPDGSFRQLQADAFFSLIRFPTSHGAVWFKAVGEPNVREFAITRLLATRIPQYIPELLAVKADWNAWLTTDAQGQGLFESSDPAIWSRAAETLAELQIFSLEHTQDLLDAGAHDVRAGALSRALRPFFSVMEESMQAPTNSTVRKLSAQEIGAVREQLAQSLEELDEGGIPDSLNHLDLNPCNVVIASNKCTFLDWAEAAVGCPLFSMEYFRQHFLQAFPNHADERHFRKAYLERWALVLSHKIPERLMSLVPLTATYAFAASALPWSNPELSRRPELAAYLRSLGRRMYRDCEQIRTNRAA